MSDWCGRQGAGVRLSARRERPPSAAFRQAAAKRQYSFLPWVAKRYHPQTLSLEKCFVSERWVSAKCGFPQRPTRRESSPGNRPLGVCVEAQSILTEFNRAPHRASLHRNRGYQSRGRVRAVGLLPLASGTGSVWRVSLLVQCPASAARSCLSWPRIADLLLGMHHGVAKCEGLVRVC